MIASLSGIRGVLNDDMTLDDVSRFAANFAAAVKADEVLIARDTRSTGPAMSRAASAAMMSAGAKVVDYGIISTPALFRESRMRRRPAVMVTASHNEPEFNGLKFIEEGMGVVKERFDAVVGEGRRHGPFGAGKMKKGPKPVYIEDLVARFGEGSFRGSKVALDLGGGAAISHSAQILGRLGCDVVSVNDAYGVFSRKVDPVADELFALRRLVKERGCDIGLAFDCDGDRLVVVDSGGKKRTGDYMLTLAVSEMLEETQKKVVVSLDTTQAVDDVFERAGGQVFRSRVGEANVVSMMREKGARLGGEGSSGGLIDGAFNYCRDAMLAALVIIGALTKKGSKLYDAVPSYHQDRVALEIPRRKALAAIKSLANRYDDPDTTDGVKIKLARHEWVLVRPSGTEDRVRVSAEAETAAKAGKIAKAFATKLKELSR